jgi:heat shock protein HslJ
MKIQFLIITSTIFLIGCKASDEISPNVYDQSYSLSTKVNENQNLIFGNWKMQSYADLKDCPYDISLELKIEKSEDGKYILNGKAPVNFYFGGFELQSKDTKISFSNLGGTKIAGSSEAMKYEDIFFKKLASVESIGLSVDSKTLILYLPEVTKDKIIFKLLAR